jgi:hypothetical protein
MRMVSDVHLEPDSLDLTISYAAIVIDLAVDLSGDFNWLIDPAVATQDVDKRVPAASSSPIRDDAPNNDPIEHTSLTGSPEVTVPAANDGSSKDTSGDQVVPQEDTADSVSSAQTEALVNAMDVRTAVVDSTIATGTGGGPSANDDALDIAGDDEAGTAGDNDAGDGQGHGGDSASQGGRGSRGGRGGRGSRGSRGGKRGRGGQVGKRGKRGGMGGVSNEAGGSGTTGSDAIGTEDSVEPKRKSDRARHPTARSKGG